MKTYSSAEAVELIAQADDLAELKISLPFWSWINLNII